MYISQQSSVSQGASNVTLHILEVNSSLFYPAKYDYAQASLVVLAYEELRNAVPCEL